MGVRATYGCSDFLANLRYQECHDDALLYSCRKRDTKHKIPPIHACHSQQRPELNGTVMFAGCVVVVCSRYIEIFQSKRMDYYSAIVGQLQSQVSDQDNVKTPHIALTR